MRSQHDSRIQSQNPATANVEPLQGTQNPTGPNTDADQGQNPTGTNA